MEMLGKIRRMYLRDKMSLHEIAKRTGLSRNTIWFLLNTGHLGVTPFDPYPYGFLTVVVSLEAIFLATFVLISQNLLSKEAERLTDLGLQTGLLTEHELTRVLQMLRVIQTKIGITNDANSDIADADLEKETKLEDVLSEIERLQKRAESVHYSNWRKEN